MLNPKRKSFLLIILLTILVTINFNGLRIVRAESLTISLETDKQIYNLGEFVNIYGNLTLNDDEVQDGIVSLEVDNPRGDPIVIRTLNTGSVPTTNWPIEIVEIVSCDQNGVPKSSFSRGSYVYIRVRWKNNSTDTLYTVVTLYIEFPDKSPYVAFAAVRVNIPPNQTYMVFPSIYLPDDAPTGTAIVYGNVLSELPKNSGTAYCPEKITYFEITTSYSTQSIQTENIIPQQETTGQFNYSFKLKEINGKIGNYTVYSTSSYQGNYAFQLTMFEVILLGDLNGDGIVDIRDISTVGRAFGSYPGHPNWNPIADLNGDNIVDIRDISTVGRNFGKTAVIDP